MMIRIVVLLLVMIAGIDSAQARTWLVLKDGTGDYSVIQDAVDHAAAGDTVQIGPGRFEEKRPYTSYPPTTAEKWTFDVYVAVTVSDLTIIGAGADQTIIGPPARLWIDPAEPKIICALSRVSRLVVEDLAMENVFNGIFRSERGTLEVRRCRTLGCASGITTWSELSTIIEDCRFQDIDYGVIGFYPARNLTISQCSFAGCKAAFEHTANAVVTNCGFMGYTTGCQFANNSSGAIYGCTFMDQTNVGIVIITGSTVSLVGNEVNGSAVNLRVQSMSTVVGWDNIFSGGSLATVIIGKSDVQLHGCQILHGAGASMKLETYSTPPVRTLDMTSNYWGTDSAATIANWIVDGNDNQAIYAVVQYEPFLNQPVATESKSWGDLKSQFR